jgi:hypothetical protein
MSPKQNGMQFSRREFLEVAAASGFLLASDPLQGAEIGSELPTHRFQIRRPHDLLNLEFTFVNFKTQGRDLVALGQGRSLINVRFPAQNLAESIFDRPPADPTYDMPPIPYPCINERVRKNSPLPPIRSYLSGPSWIVFVVPDGFRLPLRVASRSSRQKPLIIDRWLRTMAEWKIRVPRSAESPTRQVSMPKFDETCLEIPFRLFIAPTSGDTRWLTSSERLWGVDPPRDDTQELWHAALLSNHPVVPTQLPRDIKPESIPPELRPPTRVMVQARAVFSPDYRPDGKPPLIKYYPGNLPLSHDNATRHDLVKQMAAGDGLIDAEHLVLTALGADASLSYTSTKTFQDIMQGQLKGDPDFDNDYLAIFKHRSVIGRDVFLLKVTFGFLFPFAFPALAVELTRRHFTAHTYPNDPNRYSAPGAYLLKERFILVVNPIAPYPDDGSSLGRKMPPKKVRLTETRSPLLADWGAFPIKCDCEATQFLERTDANDRDRIRRSLFLIPRRLEDENNPDADGLRWTVEFEDGSGKKSTTSSAALLFAAHVVTGRRLWQSLRPQFSEWPVPAQQIAFAPEKAELSILAEKPTTNADNQTIHAGEVLFSHEFASDERQAARVLGDVLRQATGGWNQFAQIVRETKSDVNSFAKRIAGLQNSADGIAAQTLSGIRQQTLQKLNDCLDIVDRQVQQGNLQANSVFNDLMQQLQRAQQVSSTLETHMLKFDCLQVNDLYAQVQGEIGKLAQQATGVNDFCDRLKSSPALQKIQELLKKENDPAQNWLGRIEAEVQNRVQALPSSDAQRREIAAYVGELQKAAEQATNAANNYFHAQLAAAQAVIPPLKAIGDGSPVRAIQHLDDYLAKGMGNLGQGFSRVQNGAFARLDQAIDQGAAMADQVRCAVARPATIVAGISRDLGALVGDGPKAIDKLAHQIGELAPDKKPTLDDLKNAIPDSKLFSVLPLRQIIKVLTGATAGDPLGFARSQMPAVNLVNLPDHFEQSWTWTTPVSTQRFGILDFNVSSDVDGRPVSLHISAITRVETPKVTPQSGAAPLAIQNQRGTVTVKGFLGFWDERSKQGYNADGNLSSTEAFDLTILGMIKVPFFSVEFSSQGPLGQSPTTSVHPHMGTVEFLGPLKFVKTLEDYLKNLLGDTFQLDTTPESVSVGFSLQVPAISIGVVSIRGISVGAGLVLYFTNKPLQFRFNFASFDKMFEVGVMCFTGRGFFQARLATDGYRDLQGALEFGGALSFDFQPLAYGDLYVMAGFYFRITNSQTDLSGYFRAGGHLFVIGLIHASVEFLLMGRYRSERIGSQTSHQIYGICTITVSIDMFLLHLHVSITMEKKIAGSSAPATDGALDDRQPLFRFASFRALEGPGPQQRFTAYFARDRWDVCGRFCDRTASDQSCSKSWDAQYWSQFALVE